MSKGSVGSYTFTKIRTSGLQYIEESIVVYYNKDKATYDSNKNITNLGTSANPCYSNPELTSPASIECVFSGSFYYCKAYIKNGIVVSGSHDTNVSVGDVIKVTTKKLSEGILYDNSTIYYTYPYVTIFNKGNGKCYYKRTKTWYLDTS